MSISLGWQGIVLPKLKDSNDSAEVGKALLDILGKLNQLSSQFAFGALGNVTTLPEIPGPKSGWHEIGAPGEPAFQNGWVNYGPPYNTCAYRKDVLGFVHVKGAIKNGTLNAAVWTFPDGYRTPATAQFTIPGAICVISSNGVLSITAGAPPIDGIDFYAGP